MRRGMKAKVLNQQLDRSILLALLVACIAFVFSLSSHAATSAKVKHSKAAKHSPKKFLLKKKVAPKKSSRKISKSVVLADPTAAQLQAKIPARSIMFVNLSERKLLAQNSEADSQVKQKAIDAKLEGEILSDSKPVAAPVAVSKIATSIKTEDKKKDVEFGLKGTIDTTSSINNAEKKSYSGEYVLVPSIAYNPLNLTLSAKVLYDRQFTTPDEHGLDGDFSPVSITLLKKWSVGGVIDDFSIGPMAQIPAGKLAQMATLKGATGVEAVVTKKLGALTLSQAGYYLYRFYEYDIRDDGTVNSPHQFVSLTDVGIELTKWMSIVAELAAQQTINFQGTHIGQTNPVLGLDFTFSDHFDVSAGLGTPWSVTQTDSGQRSRLLVYDPDVTQAFLDLNFSF